MTKQITIPQLYDLLHEKLGQQNWWPAGSTEEMLTGMVLIQNTNWKNVDRSLANLQKATDFDLTKMLALSLDKTKELIQPSGFFNNKAIYLKSLLTAYRDDFSTWEKLPTSELRKKLIALKGIGNETADVVLLYHFHRATFVADNYCMRLFKTLNAFEKKPTYLKLKHAVEFDFPFDSKKAEEFHALIDEYGKLNSDDLNDYQLILPTEIK